MGSFRKVCGRRSDEKSNAALCAPSPFRGPCFVLNLEVGGLDYSLSGGCLLSATALAEVKQTGFPQGFIIVVDDLKNAPRALQVTENSGLRKNILNGR